MIRNCDLIFQKELPNLGSIDIANKSSCSSAYCSKEKSSVSSSDTKTVASVSDFTFTDMDSSKKSTAISEVGKSIGDAQGSSGFLNTKRRPASSSKERQEKSGGEMLKVASAASRTSTRMLEKRRIDPQDPQDCAPTPPTRHSSTATVSRLGDSHSDAAQNNTHRNPSGVANVGSSSTATINASYASSASTSRPPVHGDKAPTTHGDSSKNGGPSSASAGSSSQRQDMSGHQHTSSSSQKAKSMSGSTSGATGSTTEGTTRSSRSHGGTSRKHSTQEEESHLSLRTSSSSTRPAQTNVVAQPQPVLSVDDTYSFFAKYTYSSECALLGYNFHTIISQLGIFEFVSYPHDYRLISVTLAYIFFKYRIHHCDMALDLALTLIYLEELTVPTLLSFKNDDAFNVVVYFAFLAHVYNADRTIRLTDWYKEMNRVGAPNTFENCRDANKYVWFLLKDVRGLRLMPNEQRVKKYIQRLCAAPQPSTMSSSSHMKPKK